MAAKTSSVFPSGFPCTSSASGYPHFYSWGGRRLGPVVVFVTVVLLASLVPARGQTSLTDISQMLTDVHSNLVMAAYNFRASGQSAAAADLTQALSTLDTASAALSDPSIQDALGKQFSKLTKLLQSSRSRIVKAQVAVDNTSPFKKPTAVIKGISVAARGIYSANLMLGQPLLAEVDPKAPTRFSKSAGFHKPGELVQFQIDMAGCDEAPTITVLNATSFNQSVDLSSVALDPTTGKITMVMGPDEGGADVWVTACGKTTTMELFNYGSSAAQSLPYGFPEDLDVGTYAISVSGTYCTIYYTEDSCYTLPGTLGPIDLGTIQLANIKAFAQMLEQTASGVANSLSEPDQAIGSTITSTLPNSFSWTVSVTGSAGGCTCTATATLTVQKL